MRSSQLRAAAGCRTTRVSDVELCECGHRRRRLAPPGKLLTEGGQLVQGSPSRPDRRVIQLGQRDGEDLREAARLDVLADLRLPQPVQQAQQLVVAAAGQPEQRFAYMLLVLARAVEEMPVFGDGGPAPLPGQWARAVLQEQIKADSPGGGEIPCGGGTSRLGRPDADPARNPFGFTGVGSADELHPQITDAARSVVPVGHQPEQAGVMAS